MRINGLHQTISVANGSCVISVAPVWADYDFRNYQYNMGRAILWVGPFLWINGLHRVALFPGTGTVAPGPVCLCVCVCVCVCDCRVRLCVFSVRVRWGSGGDYPLPPFLLFFRCLGLFLLVCVCICGHRSDSCTQMTPPPPHRTHTHQPRHTLKPTPTNLPNRHTT